MKKSLLTLCVLSFFLPLSAQVGPSVTYEKFMQATPPLTHVGVLKADASLRAERWSIGNECLDRDMAVFLMERSAVSSGSTNTEWHDEW